MKKHILFSTGLALLFNSSFSQSIINSNNLFAFDFYKKIKSSKENVIFSPASIISAFAMTYPGAKNNTFNELSGVFHFDNNVSDFNNDYQNLIKYESTENVQLYNANSIWIQKNFDINSNFLSINKSYYSSSANFVDFINNTEPTRKEINQWVEKNTNGKITDLLKPASIDNATRLVLVNALYFKGAWDKKFDKDQNTEANFQTSRKEFKKTTFMNNFVDAWYFEDKYAQVIDIPYKDDELALTIILPKSFKKINKVEKNLNAEFYKKFIANRDKKRVDLSIPKFKIESDYDLNQTLTQLGLKSAFTGSADFSGISEKENLYISLAVHKATIEVNEEGTEATAATAIIMRKTAMLLDVVNMTIDKPFIYMIRNTETNCIYFMGKVIDPNL